MRRVAVPTLLALVSVAVLTPVAAAAASFDCTKATTGVEKLICGNPELSRLDESLATIYRQALSTSPEPDTLKAEQRNWLRDHRDPCSREDCLRGAYHRRIGQLRELVGFRAANGMSEAEIAGFVRAELELESEYAHPRIVPVRSATETEVRRVAFIVSDRTKGGMKRGLVDVSAREPRVLRVEDYDDCYCSSVGSVSSVRLVAAELDFVVAHYSPHTGTCVGVNVMDVFRIRQDGRFERAWQATTYEVYGPGEAVIADIRFVDHLAQGDDRAILRMAKRVRCGDDNCFCQDGPLIREFVELFLWDPATSQFRPAR